MFDEGTVVSIKDGTKALVELERKSACGACGARLPSVGQACSIGPGGEMRIEADNKIGAKAGERVKLNIEVRGLVLAIALTYLLPSFGLISGIMLGRRINSGAAVSSGFILMILFFITGRQYSKKKIAYSAYILDKIT